MKGSSYRTGLVSVKDENHKTDHHRARSHLRSPMKGCVDVSMDYEHHHVLLGVTSLLVIVTTEIWVDR